ncbi:LOW QUALITY PROTEIN: reticulocyte-binding protein 2 a [Colletotrichum spaethianum]|uniref:Reticulocyte-binding protein 2 a n=1 Tax=Colletotrichum spaethianum TaxID=700344 RepID=A0AA37L5E1_9PEZI|nr:LOW QUALITY PROTEIN: reticulocyte-binding protein 2 a [Colletotrichum spaethianum]GKT40914.1 LOW QUALITY PROTEIN: reticulocyte-binding protein 2 a [Colletotrichum spaethianum]
MATSTLPAAMATASSADPAMASTETPPAPKKYKASDLPLPSATRAAIESLAHSFKKKGGYDAIRKEVWDKFAASDYEAQVTKAILEVAEQEVERNPAQLLTLERGKAAALIDGALERSGVYQKAEQVITQLIDRAAIEERMRQLRRNDIGEEEAIAEQQRGAKTDEDYHAETMAKRAERERVREELRQKELAIEEEKRKIAREERKKVEKEREKAETQRKAERDARRAAREKLQAEREAEREERRRQRDKQRSRDRDRDRSRSRSRRRDRDRDRDRDERDRERREERERKRKERHEESEEAQQKLSKEQLERLEQEALADLLRESKRVTAKQPELEIDEALAPPPRKLAPASAIMPFKKVSSRDSPKVPESKKAEPKTEARDASVAATPKADAPADKARSRSRSRATGKAEREKDDDDRRRRDDDDRRRRDRHPVRVIDPAKGVTGHVQEEGSGVDPGLDLSDERGLHHVHVPDVTAADLAHVTTDVTGAALGLATAEIAAEIVPALTGVTEVARALGRIVVTGAGPVLVPTPETAAAHALEETGLAPALGPALKEETVAGLHGSTAESLSVAIAVAPALVVIGLLNGREIESIQIETRLISHAVVIPAG